MEKIAFLFPGQGAQYVGMVKTLYDELTVVRQTFEEADDVLGMSITKMCFEGSLFELNKTENMLPAVLTASVAAFRAYMQEIGIEPLYCAGHSLGEYSALVSSGAVSFKDALKIIRLRGMLAQEAVEQSGGSMTVINGVYKSIADDVCRKVSSGNEIAVAACYNAPEQVVLSGHNAALIRAEDCLAEMDAQITPILMSAPFHSPLLAEAAGKLKAELGRYSFMDFRWPVISNVSALPYGSVDKITRNLAMQMTMPVRWDATMQYFEDKGITLTVELGPQAVLSNLVGLNTPGIKAVAFGQKDDRQTLNKFLAANSRSAKKVKTAQAVTADTVVTRCLAIGVCTRNRNWDEEEYRKGVIEPYEKIERLQEELEKLDRAPGTEEMQQALEMLLSVFNTKRVPLDLQKKRFNQIFRETGTQELFRDFERFLC